MSHDKSVPWRQDEQWLKKRLPEPTESDLEAFCEKVAALMADLQIEESAAREAAFSILFGS